MPREKEGYRETVELLLRITEGRVMMTVAEVAAATGHHPSNVTRMYTGWDGPGRRKRIAVTVLARQLIE